MYTVEIYKTDKRTKAGERLVSKKDYATDNRSMLEHTVKHSTRASKGERYEIHETYVTKQSLMGGKEFQERYDTPYYVLTKFRNLLEYVKKRLTTLYRCVIVYE
jgi:hypothetical protein